MKKIEIIWRELLYQSIEKKKRQFTQKELAQKFGFSTSTIFQALKAPREMGAVRVTGRFFIVEDPEKLLYHWASVRSLQKDIIFSGQVRNKTVFEIEGLVPPEAIFACYSGARQILGITPADYDTVYIYTNNIIAVKERYVFEKGRPNLIVLKSDLYLKLYGSVTTYAQTFVDLWNLSDWQAKDFTNSIKEKIYGLLP